MDKTVKVLVILFAVVGIALFGYHWIDQWHHKAVQQSVEKEKTECLKQIAQLEAEVNRLKEDLETQHQVLPSKSELTDAFGAAKPGEAFKTQAVDCKQLTSQMVAFFQYLDSKSYLIWPGVNNMRAEELFEEIYKKLAANPPINVGEMEDLSSLVANVTHFYRVLGKDRIDLIKEILSSETAVTEPAMAVAFAWLTSCKSERMVKGQPNLNSLYPYACFFLNTLGGRSYLLRRDSKLRMLITYYSLLVIDMANDAKLNSYGLDIRPHLHYLFFDINTQKGLMYRERYLTKLAALQDKYQ